MVNRLIEKNIVFDFAKTLADKLRASGRYKVIMTRDSDVFLALGERVRIARDSGAALFVSIHADTLSDATSVAGATVYTCFRSCDRCRSGANRGKGKPGRCNCRS